MAVRNYSMDIGHLYDMFSDFAVNNFLQIGKIWNLGSIIDYSFSFLGEHDLISFGQPWAFFLMMKFDTQIFKLGRKWNWTIWDLVFVEVP